jgi:folate-dependent phosphoribosylglycinamide formyltransferase PurN
MTGRRVILLTGSELRHDFVRKALGISAGTNLVSAYCEGTEQSLAARVSAEPQDDVRRQHAAERAASEQDYFGAFVALVPETVAPHRVPYGTVSEPAQADDIIERSPALIVAYGCSIVREPLLSAFSGRFINVHLGLSPWYRGAGTNFWALANGEPEYFGATFMHIDAGVDTGRIIHQIRARLRPADSAHDIGNRLIGDVAITLAELVRHWDKLVEVPAPSPREGAIRVYKKRDFTEESVLTLRRRFAEGMVEDYLANREKREVQVPLVRQPVLSPDPS